MNGLYEGKGVYEWPDGSKYYGVDYIAEEEDALQMYQEEFPEGEEKEISIRNITEKLEWAKNIEKNKSW